MADWAKDAPTFTALRMHFSSTSSTMFNKARVACKDVPIFTALLRRYINMNSLVCAESAVVLQKPAA